MKKWILGFAVALLAAVVLAGPLEKGGGTLSSATSVPTRFVNISANTLSLYNAGRYAVWAQVNTTATACSNAAVAGAAGTNGAVAIAPNTSYTFDMRERGMIDSLVFLTTSAASTSAVYVAWF